MDCWKCGKTISKRVCLNQTHPLSYPQPHRCHKGNGSYKQWLSLFDQYDKIFACAPEEVWIGDAQDVFLFGILLQLV